jgi:hypothetical protein
MVTPNRSSVNRRAALTALHGERIEEFTDRPLYEVWEVKCRAA